MIKGCDIPVSYTHLDVYKRQPLHSTGSSKLRAFVYGVLSGIVEPIAGILTILAIGIIEPVMPYLSLIHI